MWNLYLLVCTAAMFGFLPKHADDSLYNMIVYNLFPVETKFDAKGPLVSNYSSTNPLEYRCLIYVNIISCIQSNITTEINLGTSMALLKKVSIIHYCTGRILLYTRSVQL